MASTIHSVIVELIEAHPDALAYLLELKGEAPSSPLIPTTGTRTKTFVLERRVDRAFLIGARKAPEAFVLVEVQLDPDEDKRYSWALYVELGRSRYRCEGALVVLTTSQAVRTWIEREILPPTGRYGSSRRLVPIVIALDKIEPSLLLRADRPYLAPLAVAGHAREPEAQSVAEEAVDITLEQVPGHLARDQLDGILGMVNDALRAHLESRMKEHRRYHSDLFQSVYDKGEAEGKAEGEAEGEAKGKAKGKAEGKAESILAVLGARGIPVSAAMQKRILGCTDVATLEMWVRRAAVAPTAAAVVRGGAPRPAAAAEVQRVAKKGGKRAQKAA